MGPGWFDGRTPIFVIAAVVAVTTCIWCIFLICFVCYCRRKNKKDDEEMKLHLQASVSASAAQSVCPK